jgi:energy-coupling factor transporter ATP-binding protein EcfA2
MPKSLSPQSEAIIQRLLSGLSIISGNLTIGPFDQKTRTLVTVFVNHAESLARLKGESQAFELRERYATEIAESDKAINSNKPAVTVSLGSATASPAWKLVKLRCTSIRGIAPPGEDFTFDFYGQSNLIYGPNGSGKSSLLGAVAWIITGNTIVDSSDAKDDAPLYKPADGTKNGSKIRDWPVIATLPAEKDLTKAVPGSLGELELKRPNDAAQLILRRSYGTPLQASFDGKTWISADRLSDFGIEPLDLQLSLIAPTIFGRRGVEEAEDTRRVLSLMLGYDDLEQLGALASTLSGNRTRLAKSEKAALDQKVEDLNDILKVLPLQLPESSAEHKAITDLACSSPVPVDHIDTTITLLNEAAVVAEKHLAETLGLTLTDGKPPTGLADQLTVAVDKLGRGFPEIFPAVHASRLSCALPPGKGGNSEEQLCQLASAFRQLVAADRDAILRRYEWWKEESAPGSKAALLLAAAKHYDSVVGDCPVCEHTVENVELRTRLTDLKKSDAALSTALRTFFSDLTARISKVVPLEIINLATQSLPARINTDWIILRDTVLGPTFATLTGKIDPLIAEVEANIAVPTTRVIDILPAECDETFRAASAAYCTVLQNAQLALDMLAWNAGAADSLRDSLETLMIKDSDAKTSLLAQLSKGKGAAALVKPLQSVSKELVKAKATQQAIDQQRKQLKLLADLEAPLDQLKLLSKVAENAVRTAFDGIKDQTIRNLKHLYPETPTGMRPGKLKLGTGKDKSVQALLTTDVFEVPGQYFANAGLQRAIALAFYFALLGNHRGGLGFIIMDDPILSLDEDHRERWCTHILKPTLTALQVILATHQRQFLQRCGYDFDAERIVELNPRDRRRRVSWRPGDRLKHAAHQLGNGDWLSAGMIMRKFSEDLLISLDAYSPEPFFDQDDLAGSADKYEKFQAPHPLASEAQRKIMKRLRSQEVGRVLNPSAHSMTEADVSRPMVEDCLKSLEEINAKVANEFIRLDRIRTRNLRSTIIEAAIFRFPVLSAKVSWDGSIELPLIGAAAAKSGPWSVEFSDDSGVVRLAAGSAVQVVGDSLEPVARHGQWVLLAQEGAMINDGDLVAVSDTDDAKYLRRVWSDNRDWHLQVINPVRPAPTITIRKRNASIRKVIGVIYSPCGTATNRADNPCEWLPCSSLEAVGILGKCKAIKVVGDSLAPIARDRQKVLVDESLSNVTACPNGDLAVVEFSDNGVGNVIKQVFRNSPQWAFVSPNPVDRLPPIIVPPTDIRAIWPLRGVLFDTLVDDLA